MQADHIEETLETRNLDHGHLSDEDDGYDGEQSPAAPEVERTATAAEGAGVEEVEEMGHDEDGEQQGQLIGTDVLLAVELQVQEVGQAVDIGVLEHVEHGQQQEEEDNAHTRYLAQHLPGEDGGPPVARFVLHHRLGRWQRCQGHGGKGVHDEVDPEHLCDGERRGSVHERAEEHQQAGRDVDRELKQQEALDVAVERASPHDGLADAGERVVDDGDVAGLLGHTRPVAHRQSDVGSTQCRGIIGAVARDGHHLTVLLQCLHQSSLVHRTCAGDDFQFTYALAHRLIGEGFEVGAGDDVSVGVIVHP